MTLPAPVRTPNPSDWRLPVNLPPPELRQALPALSKAADEYEHIGGELKAAHEALRAVESGLRAAQHADIQAAADAVRRSQPDPGDRQAAQAQQRIEQSRRQVAVLTAARESAAADLDDVVTRERGAYLAAIAERMAKQRDKLRTAVESWAAQRHALAGDEKLTAWLDRWPRKSSFDAAPPTRIRLGRGDAFTLDEVYSGLLADAADSVADEAA